jgi:hypothetical protein
MIFRPKGIMGLREFRFLIPRPELPSTPAKKTKVSGEDENLPEEVSQ